MGPLWKMTVVELKLFVRDPTTMVFTFAFPLVVLVVLAGVFGNTPETGDGGEVAFRVSVRSTTTSPPTSPSRSRRWG